MDIEKSNIFHSIILQCQYYAVSLHTVNRTDCGEEDTDLHTPVYSASDYDAPQSSQVVGLPVVLTKLPSYRTLFKCLRRQVMAYPG